MKKSITICSMLLLFALTLFSSFSATAAPPDSIVGDTLTELVDNGSKVVATADTVPATSLENVVSQLIAGNWLTSLGAFALIIMLFTEILKKWLSVNSRYISIALAFILSYLAFFIGKLVGIPTMFDYLNWWQTGLSAIVLSLFSSGIFSTATAKSLLELIKLRKAKS